MKKFLIAATALSGLLAFAGSASAADLAVPVDPVYDWTGFYLGANGGYGWDAGGSTELSTDDDTPTNLGDSSTFSRGAIGDLDSEGWFGGLQAGYNLQSGMIVFGAEADIQVSDIGDSISGSFSNPNGTVPISGSTSLDVDWFGTVRGRLGVAFDRLLIYGTGGVAFGGVDTSLDAIEQGGLALFETHLDSSSTEVGYVLGGGAEFAFNESWTMKLEYQYIDFGNVSENSPVFDLGTTNPTVETASSDIEAKFHTVRLGVNFKF
jgi:outer membrane immunogenic protein